MAEGFEQKPLSVSEALAKAKDALEAFTLTLVGEVSEVSNKPGYKAVYFTVKDENSSLPAKMWMNRYRDAGVDLKVGMLVQLTGKYSIWPKKGSMDFDVYKISIAGEGDLRQKVALLAKKLQSEGLMDRARKRPIPSYPERIGLVTSPRGAAVHDVLRTLRRRYPLAQILLAGVAVEGENAASGIATGIEALAQAGAEVVLVVRGGGSFEDLMPFNNEALCRAIASCPVPVVTGIGHEPDNSISDMVADLRASTPTAAAESIAPDLSKTDAQLLSLHGSLKRGAQELLARKAQLLDSLSSRPVLADVNNILAPDSLSLDAACTRLTHSAGNFLDSPGASLAAMVSRMELVGRGAAQPLREKLHGTVARLNAAGQGVVEPFALRLANSASRLEDLSPLSAISRGYSLTRNEEGEILHSVDGTKTGESISVTLSDGVIDARVTAVQRADFEFVSWKENR